MYNCTRALRLPSLRTTLTSNIVMHLIQLTCLNYSLWYVNDEVPSSMCSYYLHAVTPTVASVATTTCDHLAEPPPKNSATITHYKVTDP